MRRTIGTAACATYGLVAAALVLAPAVVLTVDAHAAGIGWSYGTDILLGSAAVGAVHGVIAARRLHTEGRARGRVVNAWIAAIDALVVLALAATALLALILFGFADLHIELAADGWPVVALWVGVQIVAVVLAELTGRGVYRWLRQGERRAAASDVA